MLDHGLVFDALVLPKHLPHCCELTARYPDLAMVLDHGAKPPLASGDLDAWKPGVAALARETPMVCKLSGLVTEAGSAAPELAPARRSPARMLRAEAHDVGQRLAGVRARVLV